MAIELNKVIKPAKAASQVKESKPVSILNKEIRLFNNGFSDKKKERFYAELNILFAAGVDIRTSLELIEDGQLKEQDKQMFAGIRDAVIAGESFSAAIERSGMFSSYEYYSIKIGEESGKLTEVLSELAHFFSKKIKQKRLLSKALSYPLVVLVASLGAIVFMLKFVVPMFADVFKRFKGELPYFTRLIIRLSDVFSAYFIYGFLLLSGCIVFLYINRRSVWYRRSSAEFLLRIPVLKDMISKIYLARFCQSMQLLISARTPLVNAIDLVKKMIGFYPIEASLDSIREDIMKGQSLHSSMSKFKIYNKRLISLLKVAEEVNQLDTMFGRLANQYSEEVEHQTTVLGSLIEPIMILFLGALVAIILVAMYLPMFQMSNSVG